MNGSPHNLPDPKKIHDRIRPGWDKPPPPPPPRPTRSPSNCSLTDVRDRAIKWLARCEPAVQGQRGSNALLWACRGVAYGFDLGWEEAIPIILEHYNPRCQPPWPEKDVVRKCREADTQPFNKPRGWLRDEELPDRPARKAGPDPFAEVRNARIADEVPGPRPALPPDLMPTPERIAQKGAKMGIAASPNPFEDPTGGQPEADPKPPVANGNQPEADPFANPAPGGSGPSADPEPGAGQEEILLGRCPRKPEDPESLAQKVLESSRTADGPIYRCWNEEWYRYRDGVFVRLASMAMQSEIAGYIGVILERENAGKYKTYLHNLTRGDPKAKAPPTVPVVSRPLVNDVLMHMHRMVAIPNTACPPLWVQEIEGRTETCPASPDTIAAQNGVLDLPLFVAGHKRAFLPHSPRFFTFNRVDFDFDPKAPQPVEWLKFLDSIWGDDPASIQSLQEWFGYLLTSSKKQQKMLLIVGPPRSGKGTIVAVLQKLLGANNTCSPVLGNLATQFGLQDLIGKTVAFFQDARLSGRDDSVKITETLLTLTGDDKHSVQRKFRDSADLLMKTRFVFTSNEVPKFGDNSRAVVDRFIMLRMARSFLGSEDTDLIDRLTPELPGILLWAIEGWKRIRAQRRFTQPESGNELREMAVSLASPISDFLEECCDLGGNSVTSTADLYAAWKRWCEDRGHAHPNTQEVFVRNLRAARPELLPIRTREGGHGPNSRRKQGYRGIRLLSMFETDDIPS